MANGNGSSVAQRAAAQPDAQEGLFDREIESPDLEKALDDREAARVKKTSATKQYGIKDDNVKAMIGELDMQEDEVIRVGRYKIRLAKTAAAPVSFERGEGSRLYISLLAGD